MNIYELTSQYKALQEMLYDSEADEQLINDTLEAIGGEIEDKADNYAKIIRCMQSDAEALKSEESRLSERRKTLENRITRLKRNLQSSMELTGKTKFKTALFSFAVAKNGGKQPLAITGDVEDIPEDYLIPQPPIVDKDKVYSALQSGATIDWAHLEPRGTSLRIR